MRIVQTLTVLSLALLPAYVIRCRHLVFCDNLSPIPLTLLEILIIATVVSWFGWRLYLVRKEKRSLLEPFQGLRKPVLISSAAFLLAGSISLIVSDELRAAAGIYKAYFLEAAMLGLVVYDLARVKKSLGWILVPLVFSGVWVAIFAIYQHFTGSLVTVSEEARGRVTSVFVTSNAVGLYLGPLLFLSLGYLVDQLMKRKVNLFYLGYFGSSILLFGTAIYFSGSRGALAALIAATAFFGFGLFYRGLNKHLRSLANLLLFIVVIFYFVSSLWVVTTAYHSGYFLKEASDYNSLQTRFCLWEISQTALKENPVFGTGLANFENTISKYPVCLSGEANYPHNVILNFWVETGLFGVISFLALVGFVWVDLIKSKKILAVGILAAIVYMFVHGIVDVPYFKNDLSSQFWVVAALALAVRQD